MSKQAPGAVARTDRLLALATRTDRLLALAAVLWIAAAVAIELGAFGLSAARLGSSPDTFVAGEPWRLLTSSLLVDGALTAAQVALLAAVTVAVLARHGARIWWTAALLGHVGSALLAYAAIGIAVALGNAAAERISDDWDYGVSCVLAAQFGVLFAGAALRRRRGAAGPLDALLAAAALLALLAWTVTIDWYGVEHQLAFAIGAAVLLLADRRAAASAAPRAA